MNQRARLLVTVLTLAAAVLAIASFAGTPTPATARPAPQGGSPEPVYNGLAADPAVVKADDGYYAFATGAGTPGFYSAAPDGPWAPIGPRLTSAGSWAINNRIWAPDVYRISDNHWVMYYAGLVNGLDPRQRCIGVALSDTGPAGPYEPIDKPLSCPAGSTYPDGTPIDASDQPPTPQPGTGLIDPSAFITSDGRRFVLYKTQRPNPVTTIRLVEVDETWTRKLAGTTSVELRRHEGQIENPVMVQRGNQYVLFASQGPWNRCAYATVWWRSNRPDGGFDASEGHILMNGDNTGVCGPGGADLTRGSAGEWLMFFHGWTCDAEYTVPCTVEEAQQSPAPPYKTRAMYAAELDWDASNPRIVRFL